MKENPRDFNGAAKLFLVIAAIRLVMSSFTNLQLIRINSMLGFPTEMYAIEIVFSIFAVAAIVFTMLRKRLGLVALLLIAVIEVFAGVPVGAPSYAFILGEQLGEFIIIYGLFLIAMCFRKDGLSGWVSMLASEDYVRAHVKSSDTKPE